MTRHKKIYTLGEIVMPSKIRHGINPLIQEEINVKYMENNMNISVVSYDKEKHYSDPYVMPVHVQSIQSSLKKDMLFKLFPETFKNDFSDGRALLVIDNCSEGFLGKNVEKLWDHLCEEIYAYNGIPGNVIITIGNSIEENKHHNEIETILYTTWFQRRILDELMTFADDKDRVIKCDDLNPDILREKYYICFNRNPRTHKVIIMSHLSNLCLLDKGYCSFNTNKIDGVKGKFFRKAQRKLNFDVFNKPLYVDSHDFAGHNVRIYNTAWIYKNSYFSLVTETHFRSGGTLFISEKIFKPIAQYHPFIVVGDPGSLKELRRLGYKTFYPHIDESYDDILDPDKRMDAILSEVTRLCNMSIQEIHDWYFNMIDILEHNRNNLLSKQDYDPDFERVIHKIYNKLESMKTT